VSAMWAPQVGDALPDLTVDAVTRTTLALFAGSSGDHNPIHIDIDVARSAGFDDVFAQGMLGMAHLGRLLTNWAPQAHLRTFEVRFTAITPVNAVPVCRGVVANITDGIATVDIEVSLPDGTLTMVGRATIEVPQPPQDQEFTSR